MDVDTGTGETFDEVKDREADEALPVRLLVEPLKRDMDQTLRCTWT